MLGRKRKLASRDKATRQLQASGVYSIGHGPHPYIVDHGAVEAVRERRIYSFWSGVWYTTVLSILLFWLPPFGQMIAGYVGGRKAGTPVKGFMAALAPMSLVFLLLLLRHAGQFVPEIDSLLGLPGQAAGYVADALPVLGPLVGFMADYARTFISTMLGIDYMAYPYALTVILGYVGGTLSLQRRRELEASGQEHPFVPVAVMPVQQQAPPAGDASEGEERVVVMGKVPDGWHINRDRKRGKW